MQLESALEAGNARTERWSQDLEEVESQHLTSKRDILWRFSDWRRLDSDKSLEQKTSIAAHLLGSCP